MPFVAAVGRCPAGGPARASDERRAGPDLVDESAARAEGRAGPAAPSGPALLDERRVHSDLLGGRAARTVGRARCWMSGSGTNAPVVRTAVAQPPQMSSR
ncbi:hypothetical protein GCM10010464_60050 [Pseudonocardia yunnanensis]